MGSDNWLDGDPFVCWFSGYVSFCSIVIDNSGRKKKQSCFSIFTKFHDLFVSIGWQSTFTARVNSITVNKLCKLMNKMK